MTRPANLMAEAMQLHQVGKLAEAEQRYQRILSAQPDYAPAMSYLGLLECNTGRPAGLGRLEWAVELAPKIAVLWLNYALALADQQESDRAEVAYRKALALDGNLYEALLGLANILRAMARRDEAVTAYRRAITAAPARLEAYVNLGGLLNDLKRFEEARQVLDQGLRQAPEDPALNLNLGMVEANENRTLDAIARFRKASEEKRGYTMADWQAALALPIIYQDRAEITHWRERWSDNLARLSDSLDLSDPGAIDAAMRAVFSTTNFHLHYQGQDDRDLQRRYAALVSRIVAARYPGFIRPMDRAKSGRIRVGFMSHFFRHHSISKTHGAWLTGLDRATFEVFALHTGLERDAATDRLAAGVEHFLHRPRVDEQLFAFIRDLDLDVLIYPDIGMEPAYQVLAALRLAPVQCNGLGHPVTSGFDTIDVALSSRAMEPPGSSAHYTEKLVPLARLGFCYRRPNIATGAEFDRGGAALVYVCPQNLSKLLPAQDELFARVAAKLPEAVFWFLDNDSAVVSRQFQARLARAFERLGTRANGRIRMLPRLGQQQFYSMYRAADVYLDSQAWSGCNTTFEALACGLPVVTWPSQMMRGRHSAAILQQAGLQAFVVDSGDRYVELAVGLGRDKAYRDDAASLVRASSPAIFDDLEPIDSLAKFLLSLRD